MTKHLYIFEMESVATKHLAIEFLLPKNLDEPKPYIFARYVYYPEVCRNVVEGKPPLGNQRLGNHTWETTLGKL